MPWGYRSPRSKGDRRDASLGKEDPDYGDKIKTRGRRQPPHLPDSWDDEHVDRQRNWKKYRQTQYRTKGTEESIESTMELIATSRQLPEPNRYVLIHVPNRPWGDSDDPSGVFFKVAKLVVGISMAERELLDDSDPRKRMYRGEDEQGNNLLPYHWQSFGPDKYFGQEVEAWAELPRIMD